ncbi:MAG: family 10 glycosylhydrolase [Proteobacteria bacterium]|nr:family 10 glycosylhydrolase [Pseudomonadota bacterium]
MNWLSLLLLTACTGGAVRTPPTDGDDSEPVDAPVETAEVDWPRELRGSWVATVWNINFPSERGLSVAAQKAELDALVEAADGAHLNALFFQVRPEGDALYASDIEPWSHVLTGTQGQDPGYDPLSYLLDAAHARQIEVHAWLNPYRAKASSPAFASTHMGSAHPEWVFDYGASDWMDPGQPGVRAQLVSVVTDLTDRYPIDGIHFDDYFYPYPDGPFPDSATYAAYQGDGGTLSLADWRRKNVDTAMQEVSEAVAATDPAVRFGVSPFGIYRPGQPAGVVGFDQYEGLYADPKKWMDEGWVDYLAPQLYWVSTSSGQPYGPLIEWWSDNAVGDRTIFAGDYLSKLGSSSSWTIDEFRTQVGLVRAQENASGHIFYNVDPILTNQDGIRDVLGTELFPNRTLTPVMASATGRVASPPTVMVTEGVASVQHNDGVGARVVTVYRDVDGTWTPDTLHSPGQSISLASGRWALATVSRDGVESDAVVVVVD